MLPATDGGLLSKARALAQLLQGRFRAYLEDKAWCEGIGDDFDVVICHDLLVLPGLLVRCPSARIVLDAREFYPRQFEQSALWRLTFGRLYHWICKNHLSKVSQRITVSHGIADLYLKHYGARFSVLPSYPVYHELAVRPVDPSRIRLVHHGVSNSNRSLELLLDVIDLLPEQYSLDLYLVPTDRGYFERLCARAARSPRARILPPLAADAIIPRLNEYDIGLFVPGPSTINLQLSLPNKFFEYVQARLALVVSPLPEVSRWLSDSAVGKVSGGYSAEAVADTLRSMEPSAILACKANSDRAARQWNLDALRSGILKLVETDSVSSGG